MPLPDFPAEGDEEGGVQGGVEGLLELQNLSQGFLESFAFAEIQQKDAEFREQFAGLHLESLAHAIDRLAVDDVVLDVGVAMEAVTGDQIEAEVLALVLSRTLKFHPRKIFEIGLFPTHSLF